MNENGKEALFDSDENGQQMLPFDFPDGDEEEQAAPPTSSAEVADKLASAVDKPEIKLEKPALHSKGKEPEASPKRGKEENADAASIAGESAAAEDDGRKSAERKAKGDKPLKLASAKSARIGKEDGKPESADSTAAPKVLDLKKMKKSARQSSVSKLGSGSQTAGYSAGQMLKEARVRSSLSVDQASQTTKIKKDFILALESDDKESFPPKVYVAAYVKQLCKLYKMEHAPILDAFDKAIASKDDGHKVPDEILQTIDNGKQINLQEEERLKRIFKAGLVALCVIVLTIFTLKFFLGGSESGPDATAAESAADRGEVRAASPLEPSELEVFIINQPTFTMTKLKVPENDN